MNFRISGIGGYMAAGFLCFTGFGAAAQTIISNGTTMIINAGTQVHSSHHFALQSGGTVNVTGTLILKKNLVNQNITANSLGSGLLVFSGLTSQSIIGQSIIQGLTINNNEGVSLSGNTMVNGVLTLTSGRVSLGSSNLTVGPSGLVSDDIGCPGPLCPCPGWNCPFVAATGSGQFRKIFQSAGSFKFPVGDDIDMPKYSPVTLSFTSGTFGAGSFAGVNLVNEKYPDPGIGESYLTRYWNLTQNNISTFSANALFQYVPEDVAGIESNIWCVKVNPSPWVTYGVADTAMHQFSALGLSSFGSFTGSSGTGGTLPPTNLELQNVATINGQAVCYAAVQTIVLAGNNTSFTVQNGGSVHLVAGQRINMLSGTIVLPGGALHAYITNNGHYCDVLKTADISSNAITPEVAAIESKIKAYPNPTTGKVTLELSGNYSLPGTTMEIYGPQGDKILTSILAGGQKHEFSLSDHSSGLYFIRVISGSDAATIKIIKQ